MQKRKIRTINVKETERIVSDDDPEEEGCGERARYCTF